MDQDLTALSMAAATTLVTLMATDGWERVKAAFAALWRRAPDKAAMVEADLAASRTEVVEARQNRNEQVELDVIGEWRGRLRRLVADDEGLQDELKRLIEAFEPMAREAKPTQVITMRADASGSSRIYQAGGDQTIIGR
jgi:hypothetical protein